MRSKEWGRCILLTQHRRALVPILLYCGGELDLLPDMPAAEKRGHPVTAHEEIAQAVAVVRAICNPYRAAEAHRQPVKRRPANRTRRYPGGRVASGQTLTTVLTAHRLPKGVTWQYQLISFRQPQTGDAHYTLMNMGAAGLAITAAWR